MVNQPSDADERHTAAMLQALQLQRAIGRVIAKRRGLAWLGMGLACHPWPEPAHEPHRAEPDTAVLAPVGAFGPVLSWVPSSDPGSAVFYGGAP